MVVTEMTRSGKEAGRVLFSVQKTLSGYIPFDGRAT
jgi:hypothetical protein